MKTITAEDFKKQYGEIGLSNMQSSIQSQKQALRDQGKAVSVRSDRAEPTLGGEIVRGIIRAPIKAGLSIPAGVMGEKGVSVNAGGYLGKVSDIAKTIRDNADDLADRVNKGEITLPGALLRSVGNSALETADLASLVPGGVAVKGATTVAGKTGPAVARVADDVATAAKGSKARVLEFIAPDIDDATKKILKETPVEKFDEAERIARKASGDAEAPSSFEVVGEKIAQATKQIDQQAKALNAQKKTIISKAKTGLQDFTKETRETILDINRSLKDSKLGQQFISKLKSVKTKLDADNVIDDLQDILYTGNKNLTIPKGSAEDKTLRSILGQYNTKLKAGLPKAYTNLNAKISNRIQVIQELNKSLSELVEGVPSRGASLVKQFFSPSGTKAKQLFAYIKKTTGIDIAQDAVLAKYMAELFGDTKARSLLQGIPTSTTGVIDKVLQFGVEKLGVGKGLQDASRAGSITKARKLTK